MSKNPVILERSKAEAIVERLLITADKLMYGDVSVSLKFHDGKVVGVFYSRNEITRETGEGKEKRE